MQHQQKCAALPLRVELVDNWHDHWSTVLNLIERFDKKPCLQIDADGWLSARQNLMVAFAGPTPVGFTCFRVEPKLDHGTVGTVARVEACEIAPDTDAVDPQTIAKELRSAAMHRALELRCTQFLGTQCGDA